MVIRDGIGMRIDNNVRHNTFARKHHVFLRTDEPDCPFLPRHLRDFIAGVSGIFECPDPDFDDAAPNSASDDNEYVVNNAFFP